MIDGRQREASTIKGKRSRRPSKTSFFSPLSPPSPPPPKKKQGDFHHWAPFFNRLDEFYESALTKRAEIRLVAEDGDDSDDDDAAGWTRCQVRSICGFVVWLAFGGARG